MAQSEGVLVWEDLATGRLVRTPTHSTHMSLCDLDRLRTRHLLVGCWQPEVSRWFTKAEVDAL